MKLCSQYVPLSSASSTAAYCTLVFSGTLECFQAAIGILPWPTIMNVFSKPVTCTALRMLIWGKKTVDVAVLPGAASMLDPGDADMERV